MKRLAALFVEPRPAWWLLATCVLVIAQATLVTGALEAYGFVPVGAPDATIRAAVVASISGVHAVSALLLAPLRTAPRRERGRAVTVALAAIAVAHAVLQAGALAAAGACWARGGTVWLAAVAAVCAAGAGTLRECVRAPDARAAASAIARVVILPGVCAAGALHGVSLVRRCDRRGIATDAVTDALSALDAADAAQVASTTAAAAAEAARAHAQVLSAQAAAVAAKLSALEVAAIDEEAGAIAEQRLCAGDVGGDIGVDIGVDIGIATAAGGDRRELSLPLPSAHVRAPLRRVNSALRDFGAPLREREAAMVARAKAAGAAAAGPRGAPLRATASFHVTTARRRSDGPDARSDGDERAAAFERLQWGPVRGLGGDAGALGDTLTSATAAPAATARWTAGPASARASSATAPSTRRSWAGGDPVHSSRTGTTQRTEARRSARDAYRELRVAVLVAEAAARDAAASEAAHAARSDALRGLFWAAGAGWWVAVALWCAGHAGVVAAFVLLDADGVVAQAWAVPAALLAFASAAIVAGTYDVGTRVARALHGHRVVPEVEAGGVAVSARGDAQAVHATSARSAFAKLLPALTGGGLLTRRHSGGSSGGGGGGDPAAAAHSSSVSDGSVTARTAASSVRSGGGGARWGSATATAVAALREIANALRRHGDTAAAAASNVSTASIVAAGTTAASHAVPCGGDPSLDDAHGGGGCDATSVDEDSVGSRSVAAAAAAAAASRRATTLAPAPQTHVASAGMSVAWTHHHPSHAGAPLQRTASSTACGAVAAAPPAAATVIVPLRRAASEAPSTLRLHSSTTDRRVTQAAAGGTVARGSLTAGGTVAGGSAFRWLQRTLSALTEEDGTEDTSARGGGADRGGSASTAGSVHVASSVSSASPPQRGARAPTADGDVTAAPSTSGSAAHADAVAVAVEPRPASGARRVLGAWAPPERARNGAVEAAVLASPDRRAAVRDSGDARGASTAPRPLHVSVSMHDLSMHDLLQRQATHEALPVAALHRAPSGAAPSREALRDVLLPPQHHGAPLAVGPAPSERVAPRTRSECDVLAAALAHRPAPTTTISSRRLRRGCNSAGGASPRRASAADASGAGDAVDGAMASTTPRRGTLPAGAPHADNAGPRGVVLDRGDDFRFRRCGTSGRPPPGGSVSGNSLAPDLQRRIARVEQPDVPSGGIALRAFHDALPPRRFGSARSRDLVTAGTAAVT